MRELDDLCPSRRTLLKALSGAVLLPGVLVGCSTDDGRVSGTGKRGAIERVSVPVADVPVGRARVVNAGGEPVVVAQPTAGSFVAFSAVCTHQGGIVAPGRGLTLTCPLHGSQFSAADGSVERGPAQSPLARVDVRREGGDVVLG